MAEKSIAPKLKQMRESIGLTLKDASERLGFSNYQTLGKIEEGKREVKASEIIKFCRLYYCSVEELLGNSDDQVSSHLLWRNVPSDEQKMSIEKRVHYLAEECEWLLSVLKYKLNSEFKLLDVSKEDIRTYRHVDNIANKVSKLLGLGKRPALTLKEVLEQDFSVKIFYEPLADIGSAASMIHPKTGAVIVINADEAPWRRNFDLAHELFHLITWNAVSFDELTEDQQLFEDIEKKADRFASTLLLPGEEVLEELYKKKGASSFITNADIVDLARDFGVSTQALAFRLSNLQIIAFDTAKQIASDSELHRMNQSLRCDEWRRETTSDLLVTLSMVGLRKGHISRGKFSELVGIERCDIDRFIDKCGKLSSDGGSIEIMDS